MLNQKQIDKNKKAANERALYKLGKVAIAGNALASACREFDMQPEELIGIVMGYAKRQLAK